MRTLVLLVILAAFVVTGCSDDDGGPGNGQPDAAPTVDAAPQPMDAPVSTQMGIGQRCTPVAGMPQADCPAGFECLNLNGGGGAWCSKTCTRGPMTDTCNTGYVGPGIASCVYEITLMQGQPSRQFCGIVCQDMTMLCPAGKCDGTCPTPLACTAELKDQDMNVVAKACF